MNESMKFEIVRTNMKVGFAINLIDEIDDLFDDLVREKTTAGSIDLDEIECIESKIRIRQDMLKQLGGL